MIEAVVYIKGHQSELQLLDSTFTNCGGVKGPLVIELAESSLARAYIYGNTFKHNSGLYGGSALSLISKLSSTELSSESSKCGGFLI